MDKNYSINNEKYNQARNKRVKRLITYFAVIMLIALSFLSVSFYIIEMDFMISIISIGFTSVVTILVIYFTLKYTMKVNDEIILSTIYEINEKNVTISNKNGIVIIEDNNIRKIEHYKDNSIAIVMNKFNRMIIYSNYIENYNEFYEKLNQLHTIQENKNRALNIAIGIVFGILLLSMLAIKDLFPHKIYGLLSGILLYGFLAIFFIIKLCSKEIVKKLKKFYVMGIIAGIFLLLSTIVEYIW